MAAEEARVVGSVPPPPAYYKLFAPKGGVEAAGEDDRQEGVAAAEAVQALPPQSESNDFPLEPPPLPAPGATYKMFGMPYSVEPVTEELLPPEKMVVPPVGKLIDFRVELKALLNSIMANYGQFMEMLVRSPSRAHEKLLDLETLFVNMHTLLNRYRSHQARHFLLEQLRKQAKECAAVTLALETAMVACESEQREAAACLGDLAKTTSSGGDDGGGVALAGLSATALGLTSPTSMDEEEEGEVDDGRPLAGRGSVARNGIFTR